VIDAGVRLFYYVSDEEVTLNDATAKFMVSVRNFAAELEREKIASRVREHLMTKARRGYNAGGRCYGYDNVEVREGDQRVRVEYAINSEQATIVREIFENYGNGWGLKRIVKDLNARKIVPPSAGKRGTGSWSPSAVHAMLRRERYRGILTWGKLAKGYKRGTKVRTAQPERDWLRVAAPHLEVVDEPVWFRVQARLSENKRAGGRSSPGRPASYLLSGLARCGICGGPIAVNGGKSAQTPIKVYLCQYHRTRGDEVCSSSLRRPVDDVDRVVVDYIARNVLTEDVIVDALEIIRRRLTDRARCANTDVEGLEADAKRLRAEIANLVSALAIGAGQPGPIVEAVAERQEKLSTLEARIRAAKTAPEAITAELNRLEREARQRLRDFRSALAARPVEARAFLAKVFTGPLRFTPEGNRYRIEGEIPAASILFPGVPKVASPEGVEPSLAT
jgi:site-specific DNA recombinase